MDSHHADLGEIVSRLPAPVYRSTTAGRFVAGNKALVTMLGAESFEQLSQIDIRTLYRNPELRDDLIARAVAGERISTEEQELRRLDGRAVWVRIRSHPIYDDDGDLLFFEGLMEDITELRRAQDELSRSHALLSSLTSMQNRFIAGVDPGELFDDLLAEMLAATDSAYGFIAQTLEDEGGRFLRTWAMTDISWNEQTRALFAAHGPRGMEFHNLRTLFGPVVTEGRAVISNDPAGDPRAAGGPYGHPPLTAFLGIPIHRGDDVMGILALANRPGGYDESMVAAFEPIAATVGSLIEATMVDRERRESEQRRIDTEALFGHVLRESDDAVIAFGDDGEIVTANRAAGHLLGLRPSELVGQPIARFSALAPDQVRALAETARADAAPDGHVEVTALDMTKQERPVEATFVRSAIGDTDLTVVIARDIAARKAAEAALVRATEAAESAARAKDELLATMSHELRAPLNSVIGLSAILQRGIYGELTDKQLEYAAQIESSGRHLLSVIANMLDVAKMGAGGLDATIERVDPTDLIGDAVGVIAPLAEEGGLRLDTDIASGLPAVAADSLRSKQLLLNLLSNAVKFTDPGGSIGVRAALTDRGVQIQVWDTGIGIPADRLEDVFRAFEQVDSSLARRYQGTGLGLALCRHLAEIQNAELTVESTVGEGSVFTVILPLASDETAES